MSCKGICHRYKAVKPSTQKGTRYGNGQKRCNPCGLFIEHVGINCPCCGMILRTTPRGSKNRERLMIIQQVKRI